MKRRLLLLIAALGIAATAAAVTAILVIKEELDRRIEVGAPRTIEIRPGQSLRSVAAELRAAGLIGNERIFLGVALWKDVDRSIRHGRHEFEGTVSLESVLEELTRTPKPILRVTVPEGFTVREIAALLESAGVMPAASYLAVACSPELLRLVAAPDGVECAEGYLFPDTYDLVPGMSPGEVVELQYRRFRTVIEPLVAAAAGDPAFEKLAGPPEGRLARLLTLASIVEKETGQAAERPRIASVFYNRLRIGMPLQTDPTVIYGVVASGEPWDGNLTRAHLETSTPYNTYRRKGLPPGPICNPGRASMEAVLEPLETRDLYFVARRDGSHEFSTNLADHNRAVRRYQLR